MSQINILYICIHIHTYVCIDIYRHKCVYIYTYIYELLFNFHSQDTLYDRLRIIEMYFGGEKIENFKYCKDIVK